MAMVMAVALGMAVVVSIALSVSVIVAIALGIAVITIHPPIVLFAIFMFYGLSGYGVFVIKWRRGRPVSVISTSTDEPDEEGLHR